MLAAGWEQPGRLGGGSARTSGGSGTRGQARGQAPRSRWHCARSRRRGSRAPALFGREKARTGALCVSRSHARLETRPRAQTVNARVRKRGKRGVGMAGNGQEEEQGSSPTDRQTDRPAGPYPCRLQRSLQHPHFLLHCHPCSVGDQVLSCPLAQHSPAWELLPAGICAGSTATAPLAVLPAGCTAGFILTAATSHKITPRHTVTPGPGHSGRSATAAAGTRVRLPRRGLGGPCVPTSGWRGQGDPETPHRAGSACRGFLPTASQRGGRP